MKQEMVVYKPKKDLWIVALVYASSFVTFATGVFVLSENHREPVTVITAITLFLISAFVMWIVLRMEYLVDEKSIIVFFGPFKKIIPVEDFIKINQHYTSFNTPALWKFTLANEIVSLQYQKKGSILKTWISLSPLNKKEFIEHICKINENIIVD